MGAGLIVYAAQGSASAGKLQANQEAQEYSESGLEAARLQLQEEPDKDKYDDENDSLEWAASKGGKRITFDDSPEESYVLVTIEPTGRTLEDKDEFRITSEGHHQDTQRRLEAFALASPDMPEEVFTLDAVDDEASMPTGESRSINVLSNDRTPSEDRFVTVATKNSNPENGTASCSGSECTYTPRANFSGKDYFSYKAISENGSEDIARVTVTVTPPSVRQVGPTARDDRKATRQGNAVRIPVISNDSHEGSTALFNSMTASMSRQTPNHGRASCSAKSCLYTPNSSYTGTDRFFYFNTDSQGKRDYARVYINVAPPPPPNRPPVALDDRASVMQGRSVSFNVLTKGRNDFDPDPGDNRRLRLASYTKTGNGKVACGASGRCVYRATGSAADTAFVYKITDRRGGYDTARVNVKVTPPPVSEPLGGCSVSNTRTSMKFSMGRSEGNGGQYKYLFAGRSGNGPTTTYCVAGGMTAGDVGKINGFDGNRPYDVKRMRNIAKRQGNYRNIRRSGAYEVNMRNNQSNVVFITLGEPYAPAYTPLNAGVKLNNVNANTRVTVYFVNPGGRSARMR